MKKPIKPSQIASQFEWCGSDIAGFCADVFEDANFHNLSYAMSAIKEGEYEIASEFILLEKDQLKAGCLTEPLSERRGGLVLRLRDAKKAVALKPS